LATAWGVPLVFDVEVRLYLAAALASMSMPGRTQA
jgi:hypothetical protein